MIRSVHHVSIVVDDMDRMLEFYGGALGFQEAAHLSWEGSMPEVDRIIDVEGSAAEIRILRAGNAFVELFKFHAPPGKPLDPRNAPVDRGIRHLAFDVVDIDSDYERLAALGIEFNCPPTKVDVNGNDQIAAYFRDPEGNIVELIETLTPGDPMALPGVPGGAPLQ